jgi:hypothetical protein
VIYLKRQLFPQYEGRSLGGIMGKFHSKTEIFIIFRMWEIDCSTSCICRILLKLLIDKNLKSVDSKNKKLNKLSFTHTRSQEGGHDEIFPEVLGTHLIKFGNPTASFHYSLLYRERQLTSAQYPSLYQFVSLQLLYFCKLSIVLFLIKICFGYWILSPSSGGTYSVGPNRQSLSLYPDTSTRQDI